MILYYKKQDGNMTQYIRYNDKTNMITAVYKGKSSDHMGINHFTRLVDFSNCSISSHDEFEAKFDRILKAIQA